MIAQAAELTCEFNDMRPYVSFADGREVSADRGIPLEWLAADGGFGPLRIPAGQRPEFRPGCPRLLCVA